MICLIMWNEITKYMDPVLAKQLATEDVTGNQGFPDIELEMLSAEVGIPSLPNQPSAIIIIKRGVCRVLYSKKELKLNTTEIFNINILSGVINHIIQTMEDDNEH